MTRAKHSDLPLWTVLGRNLENQDNASNLLTALAHLSCSMTSMPTYIRMLRKSRRRVYKTISVIFL